MSDPQRANGSVGRASGTRVAVPALARTARGLAGLCGFEGARPARPSVGGAVLPAALLVVACALGLAMSFAGAASASPASPLRIVSLNPSLTAILFALGAGDRLVGVDDYSADQDARVAELPRVGGLFAPSLEAVVALEPDVVVLVPSVEQRDFRARLEGLKVPVEAFENIHFEEVIENITRLGAMVDRRAEAAARIEEIRRVERHAAKLGAARTPPRVLLVLQRDPIYVAGPGSFITEMVATLGADNIAGDLADPYPRVSAEWVVDRAPEVLIDLSPDNAAAEAYWSRWPSIPAVRDGKVIAVDAVLISMPGPFLDRSLGVLGGALYGESFSAELRAASAPTPTSQDAPR